MSINILNYNYINQLIQPVLSSSIVRTAATTCNYAIITLIESTNTAVAGAFVFIKCTAYLGGMMVAVPDLIGNRIFKANSYLLESTLIPFRILDVGLDYTEDVLIRTNQKVLDILHIQISLPVSYLKLKHTLKQWEDQNSLQLYREASDRILFFRNTSEPGWEPSDKFFSVMNNYIVQFPKDFRFLFDLTIVFLFRANSGLSRLSSPSINLENLGLESLPPIFHYKNYKEFFLNLDGNRLTALPESIFCLPSRCRISLRNNNFSPEYKEFLRTRLSSVSYNGPHIVWETYGNSYSNFEISDINSVNNAINLSNDVPDNLSNDVPDEIINNIGNLPRSESLITWLNKLSNIKEYENIATRRMLINRVVDYLKEANKNKKFQDTFLLNVTQGFNSCGDRTALSILHIEIAYQLEITDLLDTQTLLDLYLRGILTMDLLADCAQEKIRQGHSIDDIETYLIYPIELQKVLKIPIKLNKMNFARLSGVSRSDLNLAKNYVLEHLNDEENCLNFLIEQPKWIESLRKKYKNEIENAEFNRSKALEDLEEAKNPDEKEYDKINDTYKAILKTLSKKSCQGSVIPSRSSKWYSFFAN